MKPSRRSIFIFILFIICLGIHLFSRDALWAEISYSTGFFARFSPFLRSFTGIWPVSLGDFLYLILVFFFIWSLFRFFRVLVRRGGTSRLEIFKRGFSVLFLMMMWFYIVFNLAWGINYNRKGISWQLQLEPVQPDLRELTILNEELLQKLNHSRMRILEEQPEPLNDSLVFKGTIASYEHLKRDYPFLSYRAPSIKSSVWSTLGNYAGFTGYYNPFTGEAQVNTTVPAFMQPYIACHEVAHQLGYAKEMEANFVGYLAASRSADPRFLYSVYLDLFLFANRDLRRKDSSLAIEFRNRLVPAVISDLEEWRAFDKKHESFLDPLFSRIYDRFLKSNDDPAGMKSYSRVTALLVAYRKKTGKI